MPHSLENPRFLESEWLMKQVAALALSVFSELSPFPSLPFLSPPCFLLPFLYSLRLRVVRMSGARWVSTELKNLNEQVNGPYHELCVFLSKLVTFPLCALMSPSISPDG